MNEIIINSVLCYINSAKNDFNSNTLEDIILAFYDADEILYAKNILANLLKCEIKTRRGERKMQKELKDLLEMYETFLNKNMKVIFVTDSYKKIPPQDFNVVAPMLSKINVNIDDWTNEWSIIKNELNSARKDSSNLPLHNDLIEKFITEEFVELKTDIMFIKNIIKSMRNDKHSEELRRFSILSDMIGTSFNTPSAPPLTQEFESSFINGVVPAAVDNISILDDIVHEIRPNPEVVKSDSENQESKETENEILKLKFDCGINTDDMYLPPPASFSDSSSMLKPDTLLYSDVTKISPKIGPVHKNHIYKKPLIITRSNFNGTKPFLNKDEEGFTTYLSKSKRRSLIKGTKKLSSSSTLKCADKYIDLYVGRCSDTVTPEILKEYIRIEINVTSHRCQQLNTKIPYSTAFKLTVHINDKALLLNPESWPEGVVCRKFFTRY